MPTREPFGKLPRGIQAFTLALNAVFFIVAASQIVHTRLVIVAALAIIFAAASLVRPVPNPLGGQNFPNNSVKIVAALLWEPAEVLLGVGIGTFLGLLVLRRNEVWRAANNGSGWALSSAAATLAAHRVIGTHQADLLPLTTAAALAVLTNRVVNEGIFSIYNVLRSGHSFLATWWQNIVEQWFGQVLPASMAVFFASVADRVPETWVGVILTGLSALALPVPRREYEYYHRFQQAREQIVEAMVRALETVSPGARSHGDRVAALAVATGRRLGMPERTLRSVRLASRLHEVGLLAGAEGPQTPGQETIVGSRILARFPDPLIAEIVRTYKQHWDGDEATRRTRGRRPPLGARILAAAERYDEAMVESDSLQAAVARVQELAGSVLDPRVVAALVHVAKEHDQPTSVTR
jgi:hypothetical protein